jgi:hypothetical protein
MTDSKINGLILIDCWEPDSNMALTKANKKRNKSTNKFFINLADNLKKFNFEIIINAATHNLSTSAVVLNCLPAHKITNITTQREFFELKKHKAWEKINHWLVAGTTWQICVHLNDMGLCSFTTMMRQHPELNFYGAPWGFLKHNLTTTTDEDFANDHLTWTKSGDIFLLAPEQILDLNLSTQRMIKFCDKYIDETPY